MSKSGVSVRTSMSIVCGCLFLFSSQAFSSIECFFKSPQTFTLTFPSQTIEIKSPVSSSTILKDNIQADLPLATDCNTGPDGQNLNSRQSGVAVTSTTVDGVKIALFETNVPGIVYGIKYKQDTTPPVGYISMSTSYTTVYEVDDSHDTDYWSGKYGHFYLTIFQTRDYQPGGQHTATPVANTVGNFRIGGDGGDQTVQIASNSFKVTIPQPTCDTAVLESSDTSSGSQVNLGDYYTSELKENKFPKEIPFAISLSGCAGVNHLTAKLTSQHVSPYSNSMLSDINDPDRGVGVQIFGANDIALIPNDTTSLYTIQDSSTPDNREMSFYAELKEDGKGEISTGPFKAMGTLTFTYN